MEEWSLSSERSRHSTPHNVVPREPGLHQQGGPGHAAKTQSPNCEETRPCSPGGCVAGRSKATGSGHGWADSRRAATALHADTRAAGKDSPVPVTHSPPTCWRTTKQAGLRSALFMRGPGPRARSCPRAHSFCFRLPHRRVELHKCQAGEGRGRAALRVLHGTHSEGTPSVPRKPVAIWRAGGSKSCRSEWGQKGGKTMGHGLSTQAAGREDGHQASGPGRCSRRHREPPHQSWLWEEPPDHAPPAQRPWARLGCRGMYRP